MTDMLKTIEPKSDQLNADHLIAGSTKTIRVTKVVIVAGEQPVTLHYDGEDGKPYKPGKSMRRALVHVWGADANNYIGRSLTLYNDPKVTWGGAAVGGIRISHMSHIDSPVTMALTASKANRKPFTVKPIAADSELLDLRTAGSNAANNGLEAYTAWGKSLTPEQKAKVKPQLSAWLLEAKEADASKTEEEII